MGIETDKAVDKPKKPRREAFVPPRDDDGIDMETVPGALKAPVGFFKRKRRHFVVVVLLVALGFFANSVAGDLYNRYMPWKESDDASIEALAKAQRSEFDNLKISLAAIRGSLPAEGRVAFRGLQRSLAGLERDSSGLIQQLDLAQKEIQTLRTVAEARGGLGRGYDFTLSPGNGMDLAPGALIGLTNVTSTGIRVNLTSDGIVRANSRHLQSGESLPYVGANGQACSVALRSIRQGDPGAASFKTDCKG